MRRLSVVALAWLLALASVAAPVVAESFHSDVYAFSITYPEGWKLGTGEGEIVTRAIGPGSAMNVSVAATSRPDFDAEGFTGAQLERIAERLATTAAGALKGFALIERDRAQLGGKPRRPTSATGPWSIRPEELSRPWATTSPPPIGAATTA